MAENVFDEAGNTDNGNNSEASYLERLVGEGKKYKTAEELAKAYEHADRHLSKLEEDNGSLRDEFTSFRDFMTTQLAKDGKDGNETPPNPDGSDDAANRDKPDDKAPPKNGGNEEVDLDARIAKILEEKDEQKRVKANADLAEEVLINHTGSKEAAVEALRKKAAELEVSPQWLAEVAFRSPKAFLKTMEIEEKPRSSNTPRSGSDVNVGALGRTNAGAAPGTYAFYENLRRTDPSKYWKSETQSQIVKDAIRMGDDFYKR